MATTTASASPDFSLSTYVLPRTAVLGALLWVGLWLRDARLRTLLPFTKAQ